MTTEDKSDWLANRTGAVAKSWKSGRNVGVF